MPSIQPDSFERASRLRTGFDAADRSGEAFAVLARRERDLATAKLARRGSSAPVNHPAPIGSALRHTDIPAGTLTALRASARRALHLLARRTGATRPT